jgi:hypothetical protein
MHDIKRLNYGPKNQAAGFSVAHIFQLAEKCRNGGIGVISGVMNHKPNTDSNLCCIAAPDFFTVLQCQSTSP